MLGTKQKLILWVAVILVILLLGAKGVVKQVSHTGVATKTTSITNISTFEDIPEKKETIILYIYSFPVATGRPVLIALYKYQFIIAIILLALASIISFKED